MTSEEKNHGTLKGLLARAYSYLDYVEKASDADLDSKTGNNGTKNFTKFSRDVNNLGLKGYQGDPWCGTFQFAIEAEEFGKDAALKHWNMTEDTYKGYGCYETYEAFEKAGKVSDIPELGCLVIFATSHMGRVVRIEDDTIWTIEGNTSSEKYDRNGGKVDEKSYKITDSKIKGFCIIDYEDAAKMQQNTENAAEIAAQEGVLSNMRDLVRGDKGYGEINTLERCLRSMGYYDGAIDRSFGPKLEQAVKAFQEAKGIKVNYPGTVGPKTWKVLLTQC